MISYDWIQLSIPMGIAGKRGDDIAASLRDLRRQLTLAPRDAQLAVEPDLARLRSALVNVQPDAPDWRPVVEVVRTVVERLNGGVGGGGTVPTRTL